MLKWSLLFLAVQDAACRGYLLVRPSTNHAELSDIACRWPWQMPSAEEAHHQASGKCLRRQRPTLGQRDAGVHHSYMQLLGRLLGRGHAMQAMP